VIVGPPTPTGLSAAAATSTSVNLSWSGSGAQYEIWRASAPNIYTLLTTITGTSYTDTTASTLTTYVYKVRAIDASSRFSPFSVPDAATTMFFTDDPLVANTTVVKVVHVTELRQAVNIMRTAAGLGAAPPFTDSMLTGINVKAVHLQELRNALNPARAAFALPAIGYTDPSLVTGSTLVKAAHFQELRNGVK
jgi:hypothetical protein